MKNLFFLLALLCLFLKPSTAQESSIPIQTQLDEAVATLDLQQVPSGLLADKSYTLFDLSDYDGTSLHDSNWCIRPVYEVLYATLQGAATSPVLPLPPLEDLQDSLDQISYGEPIPFSLLLYEYHRFRPDALEQNLVTYNNTHFYDVAGRTDSPYQSDTLFAACLGINEADRLQLRFDLRASWLYSNIDTIQELAIDFADGQGWQNHTIGDMVPVSYLEEGLKRIKYRYTFASGQEVLAQSLLYIKIPEDVGNLRSFSKAPDDSLEIAGTTTYIYYNNDCESQSIRKPLIIIEGFDPQGEINYGDFYGLLEKNYMLPSGQPLVDDLHDGGYDIIFINFHDGADHIATNAQHVKAVIRKINKLKAAAGSEEKNVVLGASMGGVVGKWALREMELAGLDDHDTRLFISYDSPLRGANICPGFQAMALSMANLKIGGVAKLKSFGKENVLLAGEKSLTTPAAKELLYYHMANYEEPRAWHDAFYAQLDALGDLEVEHLALSNGSQNGVGQLIGAGEKVLNANLQPQQFSQMLFDETWEKLLFHAGLALTVSGVRFELNVWTLPGKNRKVYQGNYYQMILLVPFIQYDIYKVPADVMPLDSSPGGMRPFNRLRPGVQGFDFGWTQYSYCFIPAFSSLGVYEEDLNTDLSIPEDLINAASTPVQSYAGMTGATFRWAELAADDPLNPLQDNSEHVFGLGRRQATFIVYQLVGHSELKGVSQLGQGTYNFGAGTPLFDPGDGNGATVGYQPRSTRMVIDTSLLISGSGELWVNRAGRIAYIDSTNNALNTTDPFELYIKKACETPSVVTIRNGGKMHLGESGYTAAVTVETDNRIWVRSGGQLVVEDGSELFIKSGATLVLGANSTLIVKQGGKVTIEQGGELRIYEGAVVDLKDAASEVYIQGWLSIHAPFEFPGYGHFRFAHQHTLVLATDFVLKGRGKGERFIHLEGSAILDIGSYNIELQEGAVTYGDGAKIALGAGATASFWDTDFSGPGTALVANDAQRVSIRRCDFTNMKMGLQTQNMPDENQIISVLFSNFQENDFGIFATDCQRLSIRASQFWGGENGAYGIYADEVNQIRFIQSHISGFNKSQGSGAELYNTQSFSMESGSSISDCYYGIHCPYDPIADFRATDISMSGFSTIKDNTLGIYIPQGGLNHGSVSMDCARLINNSEAGIKGTDIALNIDACIHSGDPSCGGSYRPNHFEGGLYFDICYEEMPVTNVSAKGNYWQAYGNPNSLAYRLGNNGNSPCNGVTLDDAFPQDDPPANCNGVLFEVPPPGGETQLSDFAPPTTENPDRFTPPNTERSREGNIAIKTSNMVIRPNPASDHFEVYFSEGNYDLQIMDTTGKIIWAGQVGSTIDFDTQGWAKGLYFIQAVDMEGTFTLHRKLILH